jgi:hypothetical protein
MNGRGPSTVLASITATLLMRNFSTSADERPRSLTLLFAVLDVAAAAQMAVRDRMKADPELEQAARRATFSKSISGCCSSIMIRSSAQGLDRPCNRSGFVDGHASDGGRNERVAITFNRGGKEMQRDCIIHTLGKYDLGR